MEKTAPTLYYGFIGVAAVGAISFLLLAIVMISSPADQFVLTSVEPPLIESQTQ